MIALDIGYAAAGIALLCLVGLFAIRVLWPKGSGKHAPGGRHREQPHDGAGSEGHAEELHQLGVDPPVTLLHRKECADLTEHVAPIGFELVELEWTGEHGESNRDDAVYEQCMCGHPKYYTCPDWAYGWDDSDPCHADQHGDCDGVGLDRDFGAHLPNTCPCDCHAIPLSAAIKQQRRRQTGEMADLFGTDDEPGS